MEKLKKTIWAVDLDVDNKCTQNGLSFGESYGHEPAIKLGDKVFTQGDLGGPFSTLTKISDYFYEIEYDKLDYEFAKEYNRKFYKPVAAGCSSVRNGNWYGRNLDWFYNNQVDFLVRTTNDGSRYASIGIAGGVPELTKDVVESGNWVSQYKYLPFSMQDGINENGVFCNINVVPADKGYTKGTTPLIEKREEICALSLVRYVLDNFESAYSAVEYIKNYVSVYQNKKLWEFGYESHFMIGDGENTFILEFVNNQIISINVTSGGGDAKLDGKTYMTNFYLSGVTLNNDGTVYTPYTQDATHNAITTNGITKNGSGLERYNIIAQNYSSSNSKIGMTSLMNLLKYSNSYNENQTPFWYTEFVGERGLTVASTTQEYGPVVEIAIDMYEHRSRETASTWHTTHSCVYDIQNKKVYVHSQETNDEYEFVFKKYYTAKEVDGMFAAFGLPKVTTADNGKTLKVVNGKWTVSN